MKDIYYIYMLRCEDNSLYTGIAKDYGLRYEKHLKGTGAKYTRARKPIKIEKVWSVDGRAAASKVEYFLKKHPRKIKERFINENLIFKGLVLEEKDIVINLVEF